MYVAVADGFKGAVEASEGGAWTLLGHQFFSEPDLGPLV
jgi:hypothetical protein